MFIRDWFRNKNNNTVNNENKVNQNPNTSLQQLLIDKTGYEAIHCKTTPYNIILNVATVYGSEEEKIRSLFKEGKIEPLAVENVSEYSGRGYYSIFVLEITVLSDLITHLEKLPTLPLRQDPGLCY